VSGKGRINSRVHVERVKPSRKVLYHFAKFSIINEILNNKDRSIQARGEKRRPTLTRYSARGGGAVGGANDGGARAAR